MQPGYPQLGTCMNNCVVLFFYATFFKVITHVFLLNEAIANVPVYSLPSSAILEYQISEFYCT